MEEPVKPLEDRWMEPDWICGNCGWTNFSMRSLCRNCREPKPEANG